jgi:hypothetical protein
MVCALGSVALMAVAQVHDGTPLRAANWCLLPIDPNGYVRFDQQRTWAEL